MSKLISFCIAAGAAASAVVIGGTPVAAQSTPTGCALFGGPTTDQHIGPGRHSFTNSHNNCAVFSDQSDTAFLNDSNNNLMFFDGLNDTVHDFNHSNQNLVQFDPGANNDTLSASNANGNGIFFLPGDVGDTIALLGLTGDDVVIDGSGLFANVVPGAIGDGCTVNSANAGSGTKSNPAIVIC